MSFNSREEPFTTPKVRAGSEPLELVVTVASDPGFVLFLSTFRLGCLCVDRDRDRRSPSGGRGRTMGSAPPSFGCLTQALETLRPAQRWRRVRAGPMESGVAPGCLGNSQWAAGITPSAVAGDGGVKWGRRWWRWWRGWWQGRSWRSRGPGRWSPVSGCDCHPERRSSGWPAAQEGGGRESVVVRKGLRSPSRDDWLGIMTPSRTSWPEGGTGGVPNPGLRSLPLGPRPGRAHGTRLGERVCGDCVRRGWRTRVSRDLAQAVEQSSGRGKDRGWDARTGWESD